jgi:5-methylcytosine-specific restriction endonuclease McrA
VAKATRKTKPSAKRPRNPTTRADNKWTEGQYNTFIRNQLRSGWMRWPVKNALLAEARVERGFYKCSECGAIVPTTIRENGKKKKGVNVDHKVPATPLTGEFTWSLFIERLYCERDNLQVLCFTCHNFKTNQVEKPLVKAIKGEPTIVGELGELSLLKVEDAMDERKIFLKTEDNQILSVYDILIGNGRASLLGGKKEGDSES